MSCSLFAQSNFFHIFYCIFYSMTVWHSHHIVFDLYTFIIVSYFMVSARHSDCHKVKGIYYYIDREQYTSKVQI